MKKLRMIKSNSITLEEGCGMYLNNCRQRNLREATINHYRQSYRSSLAAFSGERWTGVVFHLYRVFALMPVVDAMDWMLAPGSWIAVRSRDSVLANVGDFFHSITSMR